VGRIAGNASGRESRAHRQHPSAAAVAGLVLSDEAFRFVRCTRGLCLLKSAQLLNTRREGEQLTEMSRMPPTTTNATLEMHFTYYEIMVHKIGRWQATLIFCALRGAFVPPSSECGPLNLMLGAKVHLNASPLRNCHLTIFDPM
jgi:hypothetical protein